MRRTRAAGDEEWIGSATSRIGARQTRGAEVRGMGRFGYQPDRCAPDASRGGREMGRSGYQPDKSAPDACRGREKWVGPATSRTRVRRTVNGGVRPSMWGHPPAACRRRLGLPPNGGTNARGARADPKTGRGGSGRTFGDAKPGHPRCFERYVRAHTYHNRAWRPGESVFGTSPIF